jgi:hypothetical protein
MMSTFLFLKHQKFLEKGKVQDVTGIKTIRNIIIDEEDLLLREVKNLQSALVREAEQEAEVIARIFNAEKAAGIEASNAIATRVEVDVAARIDTGSGSGNSNIPPAKPPADEPERTGLLKCGGKYIDSEVIYWKIVPGDNTYESPITPHHGLHHDRYLSYEYDEGGWNNIRMGYVEC